MSLVNDLLLLPLPCAFGGLNLFQTVQHDIATLVVSELQGVIYLLIKLRKSEMPIISLFRNFIQIDVKFCNFANFPMFLFVLKYG